MNTKEWWDFLDKSWEDVEELIARFHPFYKRKFKMPITAGPVEIICIGERAKIAKSCQEDPVVKAKRLKEAKDPKIAGIFEEVWIGMPESASVREVNGFNELCTLCSESQCLWGEEEE